MTCRGSLENSQLVDQTKHARVRKPLQTKTELTDSRVHGRVVVESQ